MTVFLRGDPNARPLPALHLYSCKRPSREEEGGTERERERELFAINEWSSARELLD
jgi:hypothetical protein